jgi:SAM-dependent methyltransferase
VTSSPSSKKVIDSRADRAGSDSRNTTTEWMDELDSAEDRAYSRLALPRFRRTIAIIQRHWTPELTIANVGLSPFDLLATRIFDPARYTVLVPDTNFRARFPSPAYTRVKCQYYDVTIEGDPPVTRFDIVVFAEVLEHLLAPDAMVMKRVRALLNPGGILVMTVPNAAKILSRIRLAIGRNIHWPKDAIIHGVQGGFGHIREYTLNELRSLASDGLSLVEIGSFEPYGTPLQQRFGNLLPTSLRSVLFAVASRDARTDAQV